MQFKFTELGYNDEFERLGQLFKTKVVDNTISIHPSLGSGAIQRAILADGFQVVKWESSLYQSLELVKMKSSNGKNRIFTLSYSFTPSHFLLRSVTLNTEFELQGAINLLFDSGNHDLHFTLPEGTAARSIIISMRADWIKKEFAQSNEDSKKVLHALIQSNKPALFYEAVSPAEQKILVELNNHFSTSDPFYIKGNIMLLLSYFFKNLFKKGPEEVDGNNILHYDKIKKAEQILAEHLTKTLPSVSDIARQVALSESTLKRYFKVIFGKSIYDYYLEKKMEYASVLLMEKKFLVKEVAHMLGYEKTSSFIRIFKKYHKLPPGHLQKEGRKAGEQG